MATVLSLHVDLVISTATLLGVGVVIWRTATFKVRTDERFANLSRQLTDLKSDLRTIRSDMIRHLDAHGGAD